jgi:hypothetical protein
MTSLVHPLTCNNNSSFILEIVRFLRSFNHTTYFGKDDHHQMPLFLSVGTRCSSVLLVQSISYAIVHKCMYIPNCRAIVPLLNVCMGCDFS